MIKFDHAVIYNGVFYPANTEIEEPEVKEEPENEEESENEEEAVTENDNRTGKNAKSRNKSDN